MKKNVGKVFLVGAGPGDPGLITCKASALIESADVIVVDDLVNSALLRTAQSKKIFYVGKRGPSAPSGALVRLKQPKINTLLVRLAREGNRVVRLKGGDPFVFGRGGEEMLALKKANIPYEIVPGVSSAIAVPAYAGIPVSDRRWASQVTFITGQSREDSKTPQIDLESISTKGTLVVLMGVGTWPLISKTLLRRGWNPQTPVCAIESGTLPAQKTTLTTLSDSVATFRKVNLQSPSVIVVGKVASMAQHHEWFRKNRPLLGRTVVVTRGVHQNQTFVLPLQEKGANVIVCPALRVVPLQETDEINQMLNRFSKYHHHAYDGIIFLSANAARIFSRLVWSYKSAIKKIPLFAVGPQTSEALNQLGYSTFKTAKVFNATGVLPLLGSVHARRFLVPRVQDGPDDFIRQLRKRGLVVDEVSLYKTLPADPPSRELRRALVAGPDVLTFTSASTVKNFLKFFSRSEKRKIFSKAKVLSIGPSTTQALKAHGITHVVQSKRATIADMVNKIMEKRFFD